ncbi:MAG: polysaccharide deacetylase family protein [Labilithrix sp.]|nr:polysaccharide deacetylase family protein [Labilithrix sp.]
MSASSSSASVPTIRRLAAACAGAGLVVLVACGQDASDTRPRSEATLGASSQELRAAGAYYVGASTMGAKQLALTFDDGPAARTSELSTYLKDEGIRAVFFVTGACIQAPSLSPNNSCGTPTANAAAILAQLDADGHLVANHSTTHRDITSVPANQRVQELSETNALIVTHGKMPYNRSLFRAPYGSWNSSVYDTLNGSAMKHYVGPIYWDIGGGPTDQSGTAARAADWECWNLGYTVQQCGTRYRNEIASIGRGIVLMHDPNSQTVDMVKYLVPLLKADGYTFIRADEVPRIAADFPACADAGCVACSGESMNQCTACAAGRYRSAGSCPECSTCAPGTYPSAACTATANTVCNACDVTCTTCSGAGAAQCTSCPAGRYLSNGTCATCTTCAPGTYPSAACTATTDTVCSACDASCSACSGPAPSQCGSCPTGFYLDAGACQACAVCPAGSRTSAACSTTTNTACAPCAAGSAASGPGATSCTPCAAGTYAATTGAASCTACAAGTYAAAAGATSCTACGSCDDGDACTTDTCSRTAGCTHAPIPGCTGGSSGTSGSYGGDGSPGDDAGTPPSDDSGSDDAQSGCHAGRANGAPSLAWLFGVLGVLGVALARRRTARHSTTIPTTSLRRPPASATIACSPRSSAQ